MGLVSNLLKRDNEEVVTQMNQTIKCPLHDSGVRPRRKALVAIFSLPAIASATSRSELTRIAADVIDAIEHDFEMLCPLCRDSGETPQSAAYATFSTVARAESNYETLISAKR